jgi:hypothetical protein
MEWRKLNGDKINIPILEEVERIIVAETEAGNKLKVWNTKPISLFLISANSSSFI